MRRPCAAVLRSCSACRPPHPRRCSRAGWAVPRAPEMRAVWGVAAVAEHRLSDEYQQLKERLHTYLLEALQTENVNLASWPAESVTRYVEVKLSTYVAVQSLAVTRSELGDLVRDLVDELVG